MDTLTQITLGAAVGEAVLGRRVGNKAILWGAVAGTIPDLDVLTAVVTNDVQQLAIHRGFTHSILFAVLFGALFGWVISRIHRKNGVGWRPWAWLGFWAFLTHSVLDTFTNYGTQLFSPFSNYPAALSSIFIIDPLYTLPLVVGLVLIWRMPREWTQRRRINTIMLGATTAYLLAGFGLKLLVERDMVRSLEARGQSAERLYSTPTAMNMGLWMGLADQGDTLYATLYSVLDDKPLRWEAIPQNSQWIAPWRDQLPVERLMWFSRGYYAVTREADGIYINDLRFGRSDFWLRGSGHYIFRFRLDVDPENPERLTGFTRHMPSFEVDADLLGRLWTRLIGEEQSASGDAVSGNGAPASDANRIQTKEGVLK